MKKSQNKFVELLKSKGEKVTLARIGMLSVLAKEKYPVSIKELSKKIKVPNQSTLYRTLRTLVEKDIVREIVLEKGFARYELAFEREHHHHIVCTSCGFIEDINVCRNNENIRIEKVSKQFAHITRHVIEFFGICQRCLYNSDKR